MPAKKSTKPAENQEIAAAAAPETANKTARKRGAAPKSSAATHKSAAPRTVPAPRVRKAPPAKSVFDAVLHHDEIAREAYFLWEARGYAHGSQADDWSRASELVRSRYA